MRKCFAIVAALLLCSPAWAQVPQTGAGLGAPSSGGGGSPTFSNTTSAAISGGACNFVTTCTVSTTMAVTSGTVVAVAGISNSGGSSGTITSINICGTAITPDSSNTIPSSSSGVAIGHGTITGGTCTVTVTFSVAGAISAAGIALGTLANLSSTTPGTACGAQFAASNTTPYACTGGLTVSSGGFGISGFFQGSNTPAPSSGDAVLTVDSTATAGSNAAIGIGHTTASFTTNTIWAGQNFCNCGTIGEPFR